MATVRVDDAIHQKMKELAVKNKTNNIAKEYEKALKKYIANEYQNQILEETPVELLINKKMDQVDKHLSSFLGKIDKSLMTIQAIDIALLKKFMEFYAEKKFDENELLEYMEHKGEKLYKRSLIKSREERVNNKD